MKAIIQRDLHTRSQDVFDQSDIDFIIRNLNKSDQMLADAEKTGARCFIIGAEQYPESFYTNMKSGSMVVRYGVGYNHVPVEICRERDICVSYTPGTLDQSVAEHSVGLILSSARKIAFRHAEMKHQEWKQESGMELSGKTCAIIGFGNIGQKTARILKSGFGMTIHAFDIIPDLADKYPDLIDVYSTDFEKAVRDADIVSIHMAAVPATENFFNKERLAMLKFGAIMVNTARGSLVDEDALYLAVAKGKPAIAAIDVFKNEPYTPSGRYNLREPGSIILTPHIGSNTRASNQRMAELCVKNTVNFLNNRMDDVLVIPELQK